jgi:two-component system cell cycle response regulator
MIEEAPPDLLLLDIGMPILDGFAVVRHIRQDPRVALLPVIAVTAYAMRGDQERVLDSGFDGYLSKPVNPSSLTKEINRLLTKQVPQPASQNQTDKDQGREKAGGSGSP